MTTSTTLDGVMPAPGRADEDGSDGPAHGDWPVPFFDDDLGWFMEARFVEADALLLGCTTYDLMQPCWVRGHRSREPRRRIRPPMTGTASSISR